MASLSQYLQSAAQTPFAWGSHDCFLFMADWVRDRHGFDPASDWRARYSGVIGARRLIIKHAGPIGLVRAGLKGRLYETQRPVAGDIGVIMTRTQNGLDAVGAIRTGMGWAQLTEGGLKVSGADCIMAWSV